MMNSLLILADLSALSNQEINQIRNSKVNKENLSAIIMIDLTLERDDKKPIKPIKSHGCSVCKSTFSLKGNANHHEKTVHFGEKWKCKICGKICCNKQTIIA